MTVRTMKTVRAMKTLRTFLTACCVLTLASSAQGKITPADDMTIQGSFAHKKAVSAIEQLDTSTYVLGVDEGRHLQLLVDCDPGSCRAGNTVPLLTGDGDEIDVEALARDTHFLYAIGSHSCNRKKVKDDLSRDENLERMRTVTCQESRDGLFRLAIDPASGRLSGSVEAQNLRRRIHLDPYLSLFEGIPSKENGIDIEGLAVRDGHLFIGFRGPVLRRNWVPVMVTTFDDRPPSDNPSEHSLRWLDLGGRGIRSLASVEGGFLVLGGAVGDLDGATMPFVLYFWDGRDCLPDGGAATCRLHDLGVVPAEDGTKAEGMVVLRDGGPAVGWDLLVVYDGGKEGSPRRFRATP